MIKKLIVPIDFSSNSRQAFAYACGLALDLKASLSLYHSWSFPIIEKEFSATARNQAVKKDQDKKMKLLSNMKQAAEEKGIKCHTLINEDSLIDGINALATDNSIVIMGTKGETGLETFFMGSQTSRMIMESKVPVLSIPAKSKYSGLNSVMLGIDYEKEFHGSFRKIKEMIGKKATIYATHIEIGEYSSPFENEMMQDIANTIRIDFKGYQNEFVEIHDEDIIDGFNKAVKQKKPDVLVLLSSKKSFVERIFWGSLAKRMALVTKVPLLTIPVKVSR